MRSTWRGVRVNKVQVSRVQSKPLNLHRLFLSDFSFRLQAVRIIVLFDDRVSFRLKKFFRC